MLNLVLSSRRRTTTTEGMRAMGMAHTITDNRYHHQSSTAEGLAIHSVVVMLAC